MKVEVDGLITLGDSPYVNDTINNVPCDVNEHQSS